MLEVWTDGACSGQRGGWAWATQDGRRDSGFDPTTTSQRMEMTAALAAALSLPGRLRIVSDSAYVVNCFADKWYLAWQRNDWRTSTKKPVANRDLWEDLIEIVLRRGIAFRKVRGHAGDPMNELVDKLAVSARR